MGCVLLQLSPYFKNEGQALDLLKGLLDTISPGEFNYAIEFGHRSWLDESRKEVDSSTLEVLRERNVANVLLDGPGLLITKEETADHAYVRFHGRNYDIWYMDEKEDDHRLNRYDYLYKKEQLDPWVPPVSRMLS